MSGTWYTRAVLSVTDTSSAVDFYLDRLGFHKDWDYTEDGRLLIAQVSRRGCELILSSQWPERVGRGLTFISLDEDVMRALLSELESRGVPIEDGYWGYPLMVVRDPDGNTLYFPHYSAEQGSPK